MNNSMPINLKSGTSKLEFNMYTSLMHAMAVGEFHGSLKKSRIGRRYKKIQDEVVRSILLSKIHHLKEKPIPENMLSSLDKIFTSHWIDEDTIITGGKDNKLIIWDLSEPLITSREIKLPSGISEMPLDNCGIHSITASPMNNYLATGAQNPSELAIFSIPDMKPRALLTGHKDWTFDCCWLSENDIVSVSRDKGLCMWNTSNISADSPSLSILTPSHSIKAHSRKVRKVKTNLTRCKLATLSADATMKIWDAPRLHCLSTSFLPETQELVCLEWNFETNCILIGSQSGIQMIDPSSNKLVLNLNSMGSDWGIRSLSSNQNRVTIGTGIGKLYFYDLRKMCFEKTREQQPTPLFLQGTKAYLKRDMFYERYFSGFDIPQAIYTHEYSPSGTRLFTAGGPLIFGLTGAYAALW
ncbi:DDB1- and CUL4-associated factor 12-like [Schistocerca gregaria]|uniref:DDB1- and CUL4-associated factor 12-like n=1 Tax=Schistocerca gregaria TaxID=7010 RepID=UPI00211DDA46|nr:DDB1- and CUL4-associated factor 12-like [Schistocerca gregaria]